MQAVIKGNKVWINYHHLYYFYIIVTEGSLASASDKLLVGMSTLSSQIKQLEQTLNLELFDRKKKKLELTPSGRVVYDYADKIFKLGDELVAFLDRESRVQENKVVLKVGISDNISNKLAVKILKNNLNDPRLVLNMTGGSSQDLLKDLKARKLDLIFTSEAPMVADGQGVKTKKIMSSPLVVCGHQKYSSLIENFPVSLEGKSFMLPLTDNRSRTAFEYYLRNHDIKIEIIGETKDISMQKVFATEGLSLMIATYEAVKDLLENKELIEIGKIEKYNEELYVLVSEERSSATYFQKLLEPSGYRTTQI